MIKGSIQRPLVVAVVFTILTLGGLLCYNMLNLNLIPSLDVPVITVVTVYPGADASEVETSVTQKIEDAIATLENLDNITSISRNSVSIVTAQFNDNADLDRSIQEAQRRINAIKSSLPRDILDPTIDKISLDDQPVMRIAAFSTMPVTEFQNLIEDRIQPRLTKQNGVAVVNIIGGSEREIQVNINAGRLKSYNLSILQVFQAIQNANIEIPAGNIENEQATFSVHLAAKYTDLDELRNTVIMSIPNAGDIRIKDVAEVHDGIAKPSFINRFNRQDAIGLTIQRQRDANTVIVTDLVKMELAAIETEFADHHVKFEIATDDSVFTRATANAVVFDLILAIIIVSFVCFIFLHNIRSALMIMISVPLSIIPAFIALYVLGYSLNLMSLLALSLVVCLLVDDSIVIIENMYHHLERGKTKAQAAFDGCRQIMFTVVAMTVVIVVVFMPLAISQGMIGKMLQEFAVPIIVALLVSLLGSFTFTPLVMSRFGKLSDTTRPTLSARFSRGIEKIFESLKVFYVNVLTYSLKHKLVVFAITLSLLIGSFALFPLGIIGVAPFPDFDNNDFMVNIDMNPQITIAENNLIMMEVEKILLSKPEILYIYTNIGTDGRSALQSGGSQSNVSSVTIKMIDKGKRDINVYDFSKQVREEIMQIPGIRTRVRVTGVAGSGAPEPVQLIVQGADFEKVEEAANLLLDVVKKTPGTADASFSIDDPNQEVRVILNRDKMSLLELSPAEVGVAMRLSLAGNSDLQYADGNFEYDIRVALDDFDKTNAEDVARLTFLNKRGELIELSQFAEVVYGLGPSALERTDRMASITVRSNVIGRPTGTVGSEIMSAIRGRLPEGVSIIEGGAMKQQADAFGSLGFAFLAAIVLIYLTMVILYNSLVDPLVVLVSVPLALIGAFLALGLTLHSMTIFSIIGLIALIGVVAKNAILLIDFTKTIRAEQNMDTFNALIEAGKERLRPILMTSVSTIFGMLPIALATGNGAEFKNGMAWVIVGGLTSSMLLTLVVVPVVYYCVDRVRVRFGRRA
ncbi:MAG: efflux RND transporter permease subunit [Tannerella sp.]|jgi:HAE1 family hydrophobic/amphiphilic exporter-1|nr:efflux RND transporter permease subunit [Tannerella sp.]